MWGLLRLVCGVAPRVQEFRWVSGSGGGALGVGFRVWGFAGLR